MLPRRSERRTRRDRKEERFPCPDGPLLSSSGGESRRDARGEKERRQKERSGEGNYGGYELNWVVDGGRAGCLFWGMTPGVEGGDC